MLLNLASVIIRQAERHRTYTWPHLSGPETHHRTELEGEEAVGKPRTWPCGTIYLADQRKEETITCSGPM